MLALATAGCLLGYRFLLWQDRADRGACREHGLRVVIYPNDHRPAHVHMIRRGCEAVFNLNCPAGPAELWENYGFSRRELTLGERGLTGHLVDLCRGWEGIHGIARQFRTGEPVG